MTGRTLLHSLGGVAVGAVGWTVTEYVMHRWVLHGPFGKGRLKHVPLGGLHRAHHREPFATSAPARAAGHVAIASVAALASTAATTIAPAALARGAAAAWSAGYSTYELTHWNAHHRPARSARGEKLRARHERHHFGAPGANLGVTIDWWDRVLGTEA